MSNVPPNNSNPNGSPAQGGGWQPPKLPPLPPRPQFPNPAAGTPVPPAQPQQPAQVPPQPQMPVQQPNGWGTPQVPQPQVPAFQQPAYQAPQQPQPQFTQPAYNGQPVTPQGAYNAPNNNGGQNPKPRNKLVLLIAGGVAALLVLLAVIGGVSFLVGKNMPGVNLAGQPNGGSGSSSQQPNNGSGGTNGGGSTGSEPQSGAGDVKMGAELPAGTTPMWDSAAAEKAGWEKSPGDTAGISSFQNQAAGCALVTSTTKLSGILNQGVDQNTTFNIFPVMDDRIQATDVTSKAKSTTFGLTDKSGAVEFLSYGMVGSDNSGWQIIAARAYAKQDIGNVVVVSCNDEKSANAAFESLRGGLLTLSLQK